jgi:uncharacterized protein with ACT and thioredoxin-like domain
VPEEVGSLARVTSRVAALSGNINSLGLFWDKQGKDRVVVFRLEGVDREIAVKALEADGIEVVDVWMPPA